MSDTWKYPAPSDALVEGVLVRRSAVRSPLTRAPGSVNMAGGT